MVDILSATAEIRRGKRERRRRKKPQGKNIMAIKRKLVINIHDGVDASNLLK